MNTTIATPPPVTAAETAGPSRMTNPDHFEVGDITQLRALAHDLADGGIEGRELAVRRVVRAAQAVGVSPTLVDLLADPTEPEVARLRAFGLIATALAETARSRRADGGLMAIAV